MNCFQGKNPFATLLTRKVAGAVHCNFPVVFMDHTTATHMMKSWAVFWHTVLSWLNHEGTEAHMHITDGSFSAMYIPPVLFKCKRVPARCDLPNQLVWFPIGQKELEVTIETAFQKLSCLAAASFCHQGPSWVLHTTEEILYLHCPLVSGP